MYDARDLRRYRPDAPVHVVGYALLAADLRARPDLHVVVAGAAGYEGAVRMARRFLPLN